MIIECELVSGVKHTTHGNCCTLTELIFSAWRLLKDLEIRLAQRTRYKRNLSCLCRATARSWTPRKVTMSVDFTGSYTTF